MSNWLIISVAMLAGAACPAHMWSQQRRGRQAGGCGRRHSPPNAPGDLGALRARQADLAAQIDDRGPPDAQQASIRAARHDGQPLPHPGAPLAETRLMRVEVLVLGQPDCGLCDPAKAVLARAGHDFALRIDELDLSSSEGETVARDAGVLFPPGVFVDGKLFSYGRLSARKLRRELTTR